MVETVLTNKIPKTLDYREINPYNGQQLAYVVLSEEERKKGFVRPLRYKYVHIHCGGTTEMSDAIAETYARDPKFYTGTFCAKCKEHYSLNEFVWKGTDEVVGS